MLTLKLEMETTQRENAKAEKIFATCNRIRANVYIPKRHKLVRKINIIIKKNFRNQFIKYKHLTGFPDITHNQI